MRNTTARIDDHIYQNLKQIVSYTTDTNELANNLNISSSTKDSAYRAANASHLLVQREQLAGTICVAESRQRGVTLHSATIQGNNITAKTNKSLKIVMDFLNTLTSTKKNN